MKKSRMGRGLDDLFDDNSIMMQDNDNSSSEENPAVSEVSISLIEPNKAQPRTQFDDDKLNELADSIRENGILQPILVKPISNGGYQIVAGERRWRAARIAGLKEVPVFVKELTDKQTMQLALIENIQRQDLSPIEEAKAYRQLMDTYGMTQEEVSKVVGKSRPVIANSLRLLNLPEQVIKMVDSGELSTGHAKMLAGLENADIQTACAIECVEKKMSVRQLENYISQVIKEKEKSSSDKIRKNSIKQENPFYREYELSVNNNSNIKTKIRSDKSGGASVSLNIGKDVNIEEILSKLAELLSEY